eukprot:c19448_g1_i1.p1 GENE.c19448_g1_i1~~c19448_g1_i1.p1  ORF type:complete len:216 (+),score=92.95 c19448_g1_i1:32-649(+)
MIIARSAIRNRVGMNYAVRSMSIAKHFDKVVLNVQPKKPKVVDYYIPYGTFDENGNKLSTNIVGIPVVPDARQKLIAQCEEILREITIGIPKTAQYRVNVERIFQFRLKVAKETESIYEIEKSIRAGQIEELLNQGNGELKLLKRMREWKPWEATEQQKKEFDEETNIIRARLITRACEHTEIFVGKPCQTTSFDGKIPIIDVHH